MPRLVNNVSGVAANTDSLLSPPSTPVNPATPYPNLNPDDVESSLLYTIYAWASVWGGAQLTFFVSPQIVTPPVVIPQLISSQIPTQIQPVWFPLLGSNGSPITLSQNGYVNFSLRFGTIAAMVTNASSTTSGLCCTLFNPSQSFLPGAP